MSLHAQMERAQPAMNEEAVKRPGHGTHGVLDEAQALIELAPAGHDHAADDVGVAAEVLGRGVHDDVRAELQRALVGGSGERVVDRHQRLPPPRDDALDVDHVQQGLVGLSTQISFVSGPTARSSSVQLGLVDQVVLQAPARQHLVDQPERTSVEIGREHHVRARLAHHGDQGVLGGQARRRTPPRGHPRARPAPARAPRGSGWPTARSRNRRRTPPDAVARRWRSGGSRESPSQTTDRASGRRGPPGWRRHRGGGWVAHEASASSRSVLVTRPAARPSWVTISAC